MPHNNNNNNGRESSNDHIEIQMYGVCLTVLFLYVYVTFELSLGFCWVVELCGG